MSEHEQNKKFRDIRWLRLVECLLGAVWVTIIAACLIHRDEFTLEQILEIVPGQPVLTVLVMLSLFALKGLSIFLYSGLLYAASGVLFPLPAAIVLNIAGTAVMVSLPYWLGKKLGSRMTAYITERYPRAAILRGMRSGSDFFFTLLVRLLGVLPADVVSAYMGAVGVRYRAYLPGCLLGFLDACVLFPIMGMSASDVHSPQFRISAAVVLATMAISSAAIYFYSKKHLKNSQKSDSRES